MIDSFGLVPAFLNRLPHGPLPTNSHLTNHLMIDFLLHMEDYKSLEQIRIA
jgi:hypothetical protein